MEGVSVTDANEIYLETVPENFVRCLRSAQNAKSVKVKLTKKQTPCLTCEVELVSCCSFSNNFWQSYKFDFCVYYAEGRQYLVLQL